MYKLLTFCDHCFVFFSIWIKGQSIFEFVCGWPEGIWCNTKGLRCMFCVCCVILISEICWATLFVYKHQSMLWIKSSLQYTCTYFICYIFNHTYFNIMNIYLILFKLYNFTLNYIYIPNSQFYCKIYVKDNIVIMDEM